MRHCRLLLLAGLVCCGHAPQVRAHFLFIRIGDHAEAGRTVEVFFSERAVAGDPQFTAKIAPTKLSLQTEPGQFLPLVLRQGTDRLRGYLPASGPVSVAGELVYGVLTRNVPFLLRYHPKAVAGQSDKLHRLKPNGKAALEIVAEFKDDEIVLTALANGKPVPNALFTTVDDDLANEELRADESGRAVWKPLFPGHYCVYTRAVLKQPGEHKGRRYSEIRDFATLAFRWPLVRTKPDAEAVALFQKAIRSRATWTNFPGFKADVSGMVDGRPFEGTVKIDAEGTIRPNIEDETAAGWVEYQLDSIVLHRLAPSSRRPKPVLYFADEDVDHPLGRLLTFVGGNFASSYRIQGGQIRVVNRNLGSMNMTITVLDNRTNDDGKFLPHSYTVQYWNAKNGQLLRTQTFQDRWQRVGRFDLPAEHSLATASSAGLTVRTLKLSKHRLLPDK